MLICLTKGLQLDLKWIALISDPKTFNMALDLGKREDIIDQSIKGSLTWVVTL